MRNTKGFLGLLTGLIIGSALGMLYAPDKGDNTRDKLSYRLKKYRKKLEDYINSLSCSDEEASSEAKQKGEELVHKTQEKAEKLLEDVDSLISQINK